MRGGSSTRVRITRAGQLAAALCVLSFLTAVPSPIQTSVAGPVAPIVDPDLAAPPVDEVAAPPVAPPVEPAPVEVAAPAPPAPVGPQKVMLIGDSMAYTAAMGLEPHAAGYNFTVANEGIMGCGVVRGGPFRYFGAQRDSEPRCEAWPVAWQAALDRQHPDLVLLFVGRWELMDRVHDGRWTNLFDPAFASYVQSEVDAAIALAASGGAKVALLSAPYYRRGLTPSGGIFPEDDPARVDAINAILQASAAARGVPVIDIGRWLSPEGKYTAEVSGVKVRSDGVHLTRQAGDLLAPWLFPQLQAVGPPAPPALPIPATVH